MKKYGIKIWLYAGTSQRKFLVRFSGDREIYLKMKPERQSAGKTSQREESSETECQTNSKGLKIQSEHNSDVVRSVEISDPILEREFVTE